MSHIVISHSPEETRAAGAALAENLQGRKTICFTGDLGSGKTTFISGFIGHFLPQARVLSPTFTLVRSYVTTDPQIQKIFHLDLYRLSGKAGLEHIGLSEMFADPHSLVLIEWPERLGSKRVPGRINVTITPEGENGRKIRIT